MKEVIRRQALKLGFDACGFAPADAPEYAAEFRHWLAQGFHGEMQYLERNAEKRVGPDRVLPGAQTIITVAASYYQATAVRQVGSAGGAPPPTGAVARYARYTDYHEVLGGQLRRLAEFIQEQAGPAARSLWYVDTGPVLERAHAQRSGLGFIGKHTNLINRSLGNWILLGEIITSLPLEPDPPEKNHCGTCVRCLNACPTEAIRAPFQLDARRCISYLTIELKGSIPLPLRPLIGNRIFGCDDCLAVCPWNRFAREGQLVKAHARPELDQPGLLGLLALDEEQFRQQFAHTPLARVKHRGLLRNVCVALGNTADRAALPLLDHTARTEDPLVAEHARWAIAQIALKY